MAIEVHSLGSFGKSVVGVDLTKPVDEMCREHLNKLWLENGVLVFRGHKVGPQEQINFSRIFGELDQHPLKVIQSHDFPELIELSTGDELRNPVAYYGGEPFVGRLSWHKDLIYTTCMNRGALLKARVLPQKYGQTGFGDQGLAYDALPEEMKAFIDPLEVVYHFGIYMPDMPFVNTGSYTPGPNAPRKPADVGFTNFPDVIYPLVLEHPINKRKILNISLLFLSHIHNMEKSESDTLLRQLVSHVTRDEFIYTHEWQEDDLVMWDNWRCMHMAMGTNPGMSRLIHRTTIRGGPVVGRVSPSA